MSARKLLAGLGVTTLVTSALALSVVAPASADPVPFFTPNTTNDYVAVGSDTSQIAMDNVANGAVIDNVFVPGFNAGKSDHRLATYDACLLSPGNVPPCVGGGSITLRSGASAITRPNGSGAGKGLLYGATNDENVTFARSSSSLSAAESSAGLYQYPYALDTLEMAVSNNVTSHAPTALTTAQILGIYTGTITNWDQIGGTSGVIKPLIPQTGSGTRSFFIAQLTTFNGGTAPTLGGNVVEVQEHDPALIQGDANAVAPYSLGRAQMAGTALRLETGYSAQRAIYNVVRSTDTNTDLNVNSTYLNALLGSSGYLCSVAARPLIEAGGLQQLATPANGGVCGQSTQTASSNFTLDAQVPTTTTLLATSPLGNKVTLKATVTAKNASLPDGSVKFFEGVTQVGSTTVLTGGQATVNLTGVTPGDHAYTAQYTPANQNSYEPTTSDTAGVQVKAASTTTVTFAPAATTYGHARSAHVVVTGASGVPTNTVTVAIGAWSANGTLTAGVADVAIPATLAAGPKSVVVTYDGDTTYATSSVVAPLVIGKSAVKVTKTFAATIAHGKKGRGTITVALAPVSSVKAAGSVVIKAGAKVVGRGTLVNGRVVITMSRLSRGRHTLVATYGGSANTAAGKVTFAVKQK